MPGRTVAGLPCNIIVLDSEGIGALEEDSNHDTRIFSLAVLLSSMFIYNSVGALDEGALQGLSLVTSLAKHIRLKSTVERDFEDLSAHFPSFL